MVVPAASGLTPAALLALLADGAVHSGAALAAALGVSRTAIWKAVERLRGLGVGIEALSRQGYRLQRPLELLSEERIRAALGAPGGARLRHCDIPFVCESTNSQLLAAPPPPHGAADVCLCELQSAGRGRRGRRWLAPFGGSIALSLAWSFGEAARVTPSLSLAVGVAVRRALSRAGARDIGLKWPNDLWFADRKLGGILLELRAEASGPAHVVIGIGINVMMSASERAEIGATGVAAASVDEACSAPPSRNVVAGAIVDELLSMLVLFEREGFEPFLPEWAAGDALRNRRAQVLLGERCVVGIAQGVDSHGALRLDVGGRIQEFVSGEVSLRLAEG